METYYGDVQLDWNILVVEPLKGLAANIIGFLPDLVEGILIVILGWLLAKLIKVVVGKFLKSINFNALATQLGFSSEGGEGNITPQDCCANVAYWITMFSAVLMALKVFRFNLVSGQLGSVYGYIITVFVLSIIAVIGVFASMLAYRAVKATAQKAGLAKADVLANVVKWTVLLFTLVLCLLRLGVPEDIMVMIFGATYLTFLIICVISFGFGGASVAGDFLRKLLSKKQS